MARDQKGDYDGALVDYNEALTLLPTYWEVYNQADKRGMKMGQWDKAEADFTRLLELNPDYVLAHQRRGLVREKQGDDQGAIDDFTVILQHNPRDVRAYHGRGSVRFESGDLAGALADLDKALTINPAYIAGHLFRIHILRDQDDRDGALAAAERLVALQAKSPDALLDARRNPYLARRRGQGSCRLQCRPRPQSGHAVGHFRRGWLYLSEGRSEEAARDAETGLKLEGWKGKQAPYLALLAHLAYRRGRHPKDAARVVDKALANTAKTWPYRILKYLHGDVSDADLLHDAADNDQRTEVHAYVGVALWLSGSAEKARKHLDWVREKGNRRFVEYGLAQLVLRHLEDAPPRKP